MQREIVMESGSDLVVNVASSPRLYRPMPWPQPRALTRSAFETLVGSTLHSIGGACLLSCTAVSSELAILMPGV